MSDYTKNTNFATKDTLPSGNSGKIVKGTEIDTEFNAIASAITSKADKASPTFTGTPSAPTATAGSNTTQLANTAYVKQEITALGTIGTMAAQAASAVAITGGTITGITDITVADGGTGRSTLAANEVLLGNGTSGINSVAPSTSGNVLTSNGTTWTSSAPASVKGLGIGGEVWNNVTGSRAFNSLYTNSRAYPIAVSASTTCSTSARITAYVNGVQIAYYGWQFNGCGAYGGTFIIVPAGATYQLNAGEGVQNWMELY
jgi:hypothetical protein